MTLIKLVDLKIELHVHEVFEEKLIYLGFVIGIGTMLN